MALGKSNRQFRLPWRTGPRIRADLDTELQFHLDMRREELMASGLSRDDARREAEREFGDLAYTRQYCEGQDRVADRDVRRAEWLSEFVDDIKWTLRGIRRRPSYTAVIVLTLALGVGANAAVFSVLNAVLLHGASYREPDRLVAIDENNVPGGARYSDVAAAEYLDWTSATRSFEGIAAAGQRSLTYAEGTTPVQISGRRVSANYFDVLGVAPALGRTFRSGEDRGVNRVIVLTDGIWRRLFGADSSVVGRQVPFSGDSYTVIGVLRPEFVFPGAIPQVFIPIDFAAAMADVNRARKFHFTHAVGRLRPGVTPTEGAAELLAIAHRAEQANPDVSTGHFVSVRPLQDAVVGGIRPTLFALAGAALFVLLIACSNVANLALARTQSRRREIAVRTALGASHSRLVRQTLTESVVLALLGGVAGTLAGLLATPALIALYPRALPPGFVVHVEPAVLLFATLIASLSGVAFGLLPAISARRGADASVLRDGARSSTVGASGTRTRRVLVASQLATAMILLVGAGLLVRTLERLQSIDLGFDGDQVVTMGLSLPGAKYSDRESILRFWDALLARLQHEPGFASLSLSGSAPLLGGSGAGLEIEGQPNNGPPPTIRYTTASEDFLRTLRVPVRAGRAFTREDRTQSTPLVMVNEAAARKFWPGQNPIGAHVRLGPDPSQPWGEVIGVVGDYRQENLDDVPPPLAITFFHQDVWSSMTLSVRTTDAAPEARRKVATAVRELDPTLAVQSPFALTDAIAATLAPRRFAMSLLAVFAGVALLLAIVGVYGVTAYGVNERTREFGIRLALGAIPRHILGIVVKQTLKVAAVGLGIGLVCAIGLTRFLSGLLYGVRPLDVVTFASVGVLLLGATLAACWLPARRASSVDPMHTLRDE
jgi:putative ABC transport system permease protein